MMTLVLYTVFLCIGVFGLLVVKLRVPAGSAVLFSAGTGALSGPAVLAAGRVVQLTPLQAAVVVTVVYGGILASAMLIHFFRDPERHDPAEPGALVSPADGTVLYVKRIEKGMVPVSEKKGRAIPLAELVRTDLLSGAAYLVGIEMNILNVHVNRSPAAGAIVHLQHIPGMFLSLRDEDAPFRNERCTTVIDTGSYLLGVVQIASRLVRRIVSYVDQGQSITRGQRIGMIKFGSQVDVVIPAMDGLRITVKPGDAVTAGESVITAFSATT